MGEYLKAVQENLKENIEAGNLPLDQQFALIDTVMLDLLGHSLIDETAFKKHREIIKQHTDKIIESQKAITDRYHKSYDAMLKI